MMDKVGRIAISSVLLLSSLAVLPSLAQAQAQEQEQSDDWRVNGMIYFFIPHVDAVASEPNESGSDTTTIRPGDIAGFVDFAFMGTLHATNGKVGFVSDMIYARLGETASASRDFTIDGIFFEIPASLTADIDVEHKSFIWTFGPTVRLINRPEFQLDALAGARLNESKQRLDYEFNATIGPITDINRVGSSITHGTDWNGIVGLTGRVHLGSSKDWSIPIYADVGTGDSSLTYQLASGLSYDIDWVRIDLLYRHLEFDMKAGGALRKLRMTGPQIGVGFKF